MGRFSLSGDAWVRSERNAGGLPLRLGSESELALAAVEVGFDFGDGVETLGDEVGVGDFYVELLLEPGDQVGEGERVESAGVEQGLIGGGVVGDVGYRVYDFEDACLGAHGFTCFTQFVTACVAFDEGGFISFPVISFSFRFTLGAGQGRLVGVVLLDDIRKQSAGEFGIAFAGEVGVVGLGPADGDPVAHGAEASHAGALVPVGAVHLTADAALGGDDAIDSAEWLPVAAAGAEGAVGRADDQDGGVGGEAVAAFDDALEHGGVALFGPVAVAGLVGAVGEDDEGGVGLEHQGLLEGFVPAEEERGFGAVDAGRLVGHARGVFGREAEEADGGLVDGEDFEVVGAGFDGRVEVAGGVGCEGVGAGRRDGGD